MASYYNRKHQRTFVAERCLLVRVKLKKTPTQNPSQFLFSNGNTIKGKKFYNVSHVLLQSCCTPSAGRLGKNTSVAC